ncbi:calmodulin-like [Primulina huaijiensis]|uniref:calmodulin-like n=1 Tax=Primulina huaijiensis TaxID=1492673 RepID=UPI003CC6F6B5
MAEALGEERIAEFRDAFCLIDKNSDGVIDIEELAIAIQSLDENTKREELEEMMNEVDGEMDFEEFINIMARKIKENMVEELREAFQVFDRDQDGFVSAIELKIVMINLGKRLTNEEATQMIIAADVDGDGLISCDEFVKIMLASSF